MREEERKKDENILKRAHPFPYQSRGASRNIITGLHS